MIWSWNAMKGCHRIYKKKIWKEKEKGKINDKSVNLRLSDFSCLLGSLFNICECLFCSVLVKYFDIHITSILNRLTQIWKIEIFLKTCSIRYVEQTIKVNILRLRYQMALCDVNWIHNVRYTDYKQIGISLLTFHYYFC